MSRIERSITIEADAATVWATVADLESVATWSPNVAVATCGPVSRGVGATRRCELMPRGNLEQVVSTWSPGEELWFAIGNHGGIRSADMGIVLTPADGGTTVTAISDYHLAFGPLGPVVDRLTMRRSMTRIMDASPAGLKKHVETLDAKEGSKT